MTKRARMRYPRPLSGFLRESLTELGLSERLREAEIWSVWQDVVGATVAARAQPLRIINGTLTVAVSSAPWIQELRFMTGMIMEKINDRLGGDVVRQIVLKAGMVSAGAIEPKEETTVRNRLTPRQKLQIEELSSSIQDPETRRAFAEFMQASLEYSIPTSRKK